MAKRKKYKRTNNDLQNIHIKLKYTATPITSGGVIYTIKKRDKIIHLDNMEKRNKIQNLVINKLEYPKQA